MNWTEGLQTIRKPETDTAIAPVNEPEVKRAKPQPKKSAIRARRRLILKLARIAKPVSVSRLAGELASRTGTPVQSAVQMIYGMAHRGDLPLDWLTLAANFRRVVPAPRSEPVPAQPLPHTKTKRNQQIVDGYRAGVSAHRLAAEHGVCVQRVRQIVRKARLASYGPPPAPPNRDAVRVLSWALSVRGSLPSDVAQILQRHFSS